MRGLVLLAGALVLAACSGETGATGPLPSETGGAVARKTVSLQEAPVSAASCIERARGTGMRAEIARPCHEQACEAGDARACEILKNYDGFAAGREADSGEDNGEAEPAANGEQPEA